MLIDTHCHLNMMVKKKFDIPLKENELKAVSIIVKDAKKHDVEKIITVGTNLIENNNCIEIAKRYSEVYATVGLHPTDCTATWRDDLKAIEELVKNKEKNKIVGIGECGLDFYWPNYNMQRQIDAFKAQIELALKYDLALTIHFRNASDETLHVLEEYKDHIKGVLHCFSENQLYAEKTIGFGLLLGIGGVITYPKNEELRSIVKNIPIETIVLETDAPWLPPQIARGKQNHPKYINTIAHFIAELRNVSFEQVTQQTTANARALFNI